MCRVVLYIAFMATLQVLVDARTCWIFVFLCLCLFSFSPSCGLLIRLRSRGHPVRPWCFSFVVQSLTHLSHRNSEVIFLCWWMQHANLR